MTGSTLPVTRKARLRRAAKVLAVIGSVFVGGYFVGGWFSNRITNDVVREAGGFAVLTLAAVAGIRKCLASLPELVDYVRGTKKLSSKIVENYIEGGFALFLMTASAAIVAAEDVDTPPRKIELKLPALPPAVVELHDPRPVFTVSFDEGSTELAPANRDHIRNVAAMLRDCAARDAQVAVIVRGYASTSGTERGNLVLADQRAAVVAEELQAVSASSALSQEPIRIEVRKWPHGSAMRVNSRYVDRDDKGQYLNNAGLLNRRAEIQVTQAGSCAQ
jgi:hypothetical protein